jgi:hypothetical protein
VSRRVEGLKGPRRVRPVKTSSKRMGRPVQVCGSEGAGEEEKRGWEARMVVIRVRWKRGSLGVRLVGVW